MNHANVLILMEWYDHRIREGIGRCAAEKNWYVTVNDGCALPQGWSGDGIVALINKRDDIIRYISNKRAPCVDLGSFRLDIPLPRIHGDHLLIGETAADHLLERGYHDAGYTVPDDIAIVGVDNDTLVCENIRVPLSSVRHDLVRIGYDGAALLNRIMLGEKPPREPGLVPPRGVELRASTDSATHSDPLIRAAMRYFRENLGKSIGVADVATALNVPRHRLSRHFEQATGKTAYATLIVLRLLEVKRLLSLTDISIKDIAATTGFCHAQHLSNVFRRAEGITPLKFRRIERGNSSRR